jgi:hypothetical protein
MHNIRQWDTIDTRDNRQVIDKCFLPFGPLPFIFKLSRISRLGDMFQI